MSCVVRKSKWVWRRAGAPYIHVTANRQQLTLDSSAEDSKPGRNKNCFPAQVSRLLESRTKREQKKQNTRWEESVSCVYGFVTDIAVIARACYVAPRQMNSVSIDYQEHPMTMQIPYYPRQSRCTWSCLPIEWPITPLSVKDDCEFAV